MQAAMATKGLRMDQSSDYDSHGAPSVALTTFRNLGATQKGENEYEDMENVASKVNLQQVIQSEDDEIQANSFLANGKREKRNCKMFLRAFLAVLIVVAIIGLAALVGVYISQLQYNTALKIRNEELEKNLEARLNTTIFALDDTPMTQLSGLFSLVDNLKSLVDNLNITTTTQLSSLQNLVDALNDTTTTQLRSLQSSVNTLNTDKDTATIQLRSLQSSVNTWNGTTQNQLSSLQTAVNAVNDTTQNQLSSLQTAVNAVNDTTQNQLSTVSSLQTAVNAVNDTTQNQLSSLQTAVNAVNETTQNQLSSLQTTVDSNDANIQARAIQIENTVSSNNLNIQRSVNSNLASIRNINGRGTVYTRWGSSSCPFNTVRLYNGRVGGTRFNHQGGASNLLCLPERDIRYEGPRSGFQGYSTIYGAEYEDPLRAGANQGNVPCAVCFATSRYESLMIPARLNCPTGWTVAYSGYLMSERNTGDNHRSSFICVDASQEEVPVTSQHTLATDLFHVEVDCDSLPCGVNRYNSDSELTCVVCTKSI